MARLTLHGRTWRGELIRETHEVGDITVMNDLAETARQLRSILMTVERAHCSDGRTVRSWDPGTDGEIVLWPRPKPTLPIDEGLIEALLARDQA